MNMREELKRSLSAYGLVPKRGLGQNFLVDEAAVAAIADAAVCQGLPLLEIGPGLGALTRALLQRGARVTAVEKDRELSDILPDLVGDNTNLTIINADIMEVDILNLMGGRPFAAVGNLPYYITTPASERLLLHLPERCALMVQREAAERFFARPGARVYGPLAILSQVYFQAAPLLSVGRNSFYPVPGVDSAVVLLNKKDGDFPPPKGFFDFLNRAFSMRRKTLINNLKGISGAAAAMESLSLPPAVRAEALSPETLLALYRRLEAV